MQVQPIQALAITAYSATSAAGRGCAALAEALRTRRSGLRANDFPGCDLRTMIGRVEDLERQALPQDFAVWECRNNRLAWMGLAQDGLRERIDEARARYGASRIAVVLGTSTSSIGASEEAYARLQDGRIPADLMRPVVHTPSSLVDFVQHVLRLEGPAITVATACSSSAKVFASAERLIRLGLADAVVVGGVDTLCGSVLFGFNSLELVSPEACRPFDVARRGINIGEAAGFALLERVDAQNSSAPRIIGYGESSDAHHMSSPHPEGLGARLAMRDALARAGIDADAVDYINCHGTSSQKNDEVEAALIADLFPAHTLASSTKGWTGHTLGAAGILEAVISLLALEHGFAPGTLNLTDPDPACGPQIQADNVTRTLRVALSNSFGFGGNNCCLAFARGGAA
jgi:3-oxoacyl-[acyl-carrier-protein] synthase-1